MNDAYRLLKNKLAGNPKSWLVTGCAGFIGSNLLEELLKLGQSVTGLDNFATGYEKNLEEVKKAAGPENWSRFRFIKGDIRNLEDCREACKGVDHVLHQAALGSVPRSINNPLDSNDVNVNGHLNVMVAARDARVRRIVYASSSSVYGDHPVLPKIEEQTGNLLSPYAATKHVNEAYAGVFSRTYGLEAIGLRYFNVFGRRQSPNGPYAAVIPLWFNGLLKGEPVFINGDGQTSRDFTYVDNVVQVNLLAATAELPESKSLVFNVACGDRTTLNELYNKIQEQVGAVMRKHGKGDLALKRPEYRPFRPGDIHHSLADISKAKSILKFQPEFSVEEGLRQAAEWYFNYFSNA